MNSQDKIKILKNLEEFCRQDIGEIRIRSILKTIAEGKLTNG